jgi:hypothetical protein
LGSFFVSFVRSADLHPQKMLHHARMAGLVKLHCGVVSYSERLVRAVRTGSG